MLSIAYAIELNIMLIAAQNHCVIPVNAGIATYKPLALLLGDTAVRAESSSHKDTVDREQVVKLAHFRALLSG